MYPTLDQVYCLIANHPVDWRLLALFVGLPALMSDPRFRGTSHRYLLDIEHHSPAIAALYRQHIAWSELWNIKRM